MIQNPLPDAFFFNQRTDVMELQEILSLDPKFHLDGQQRPITWAIGVDVLTFIGETVPAGSRTLETGSGLSTVYFATRGYRHTAITPAADEIRKIRQFCSDNAISLEAVEFVESRSEYYLPKLEGEELDLVLIDGRHGFPTPYIDWFYAAELLKVGGLMVVDDTQICTGRELAEFLREDGHWVPVRDFHKTAAFRKLDERVHAEEWINQPYVFKRSQSSPGLSDD